MKFNTLRGKRFEWRPRGDPAPSSSIFQKTSKSPRRNTPRRESGESPLPAVRQYPDLDTEGIDKLLEALERAKRPVIIGGAGIIKSGASAELVKFAKTAGIPVINTLLGLGGFPGTDDLFLGMPGMHGTAYANFALCECDLLLNLGARFDDRVTGKVSSFCPKAIIAHVDIDDAEIDKRVHTHIPILGNVRDVLAELNQRLTPGDYEDWQQTWTDWKENYPLQYDWDGTIKPQYVIDQIQEITEGNGIYVTGVGQHQMWAAQFIRFNEPKTWVTSGGLGTMGFGLPAAIGAKFARPEKDVWLIDGDGSFAMTLVELATAATYNVPVKVAILNNAYLGMVRQWQELFFEKRYSHSHYPENPDFAAIAEGYGVKGININDVNEVRNSLETAAGHDGPVVLNFMVNKEENVWPMVPAGAGNDEMQLAPPSRETKS